MPPQFLVMINVQWSYRRDAWRLSQQKLCQTQQSDAFLSTSKTWMPTWWETRNTPIPLNARLGPAHRCTSLHCELTLSRPLLYTGLGDEPFSWWHYPCSASEQHNPWSDTLQGFWRSDSLQQLMILVMSLNPRALVGLVKWPVLFEVTKNPSQVRITHLKSPHLNLPLFSHEPHHFLHDDSVITRTQDSEHCALTSDELFDWW